MSSTGNLDPQGDRQPAARLLIDALGLACPAPIIKLARAVSGLADATLVEVLTDDPAARFDVPAWCRLRGASYLGATPISGDSVGSDALRHRILWGPG